MQLNINHENIKVFILEKILHIVGKNDSSEHTYDSVIIQELKSYLVFCLVCLFSVFQFPAQFVYCLAGTQQSD